VRLGFFVNKTTDIKLVVARGSSLKISTKPHGNVFFLDKNLQFHGSKNAQFPQQKSVSGNLLRKNTCCSFTVRLIDVECFLFLRIQVN